MMGEPDQMYLPGSDAADTFTELQKALLGAQNGPLTNVCRLSLRHNHPL